jgi:hypothetical protein
MRLFSAFGNMSRITAFYISKKSSRKKTASDKRSAYGEKSSTGRGKTSAVNRKRASVAPAAAAYDRQAVPPAKQRFMSLIKQQMFVRIRQCSAALRTTENKKAILLIALMIPLIFLVFLLFSNLNE